MIVTQELLKYIELIREIASREYEKDILFYNEGAWYSREHCREITLDELEDFILRITEKPEYDDYEE